MHEKNTGLRLSSFEIKSQFSCFLAVQPEASFISFLSLFFFRSKKELSKYTFYRLAVQVELCRL